MSAGDVASAAVGAGFNGRGLVTAIAVALAESNGNPSAHNTNGEDSRGLWQINVAAHPQYASYNLYDPLTNAQVAYAISSGGTSWTAWSTYLNGAYLGYWSQAQQLAGVSGSSAPPPTGGSPSVANVGSWLQGTTNLGGLALPNTALLAGGILALLVVVD